MLISAMDREIASMLKNNGCIKLEVTAVYDTTICGYFNDRFITILNRGKKSLPMSIVVLDELNSRNYMPGDLITISRNYGDTFAVNEDTDIVDMVMPVSKSSHTVEIKYGHIRGFLGILEVSQYGMLPIISKLEKIDNNHSFFEKDIAMKTYIMDQISLILTELKEKKTITAKNIIGYGVGLTPSADDFILGMLSVFDHYNEINRRNILSEYIKKYSHTTTEVSGWMLKYGFEKKLYPHIVVDYFTQRDGEGNLAADFLKHGSSSGIDMLCGMLCGLNILRKGDR